MNYDKTASIDKRMLYTRPSGSITSLITKKSMILNILPHRPGFNGVAVVTLNFPFILSHYHCDCNSLTLKLSKLANIYIVYLSHL